VLNGTSSGIEFFHGYTYSGHPLAAAAGMAALDVYEQEGLFTRAASLSAYWTDAVHSLRGLPHVIDLRNLGLMAGIELESRPDAPATRAYDVFTDCFAQGVMMRTTGDTVAMSPPLIAERNQIDQMFETLGRALRRVA
jgi:beta-alanine--pyruvate transaminase